LGLPKAQLDILRNALIEGSRPVAIAAYFGDQGWLTVQEKTFVQYIQAFKRTYPEMLSGVDPMSEDGKADLNNHVNPRQPSLDEEVVLEQLIRTQKSRVAIGLAFEKQTSIVSQHLHKDINTTLELVKTLAQMRGKMAGAGRPSAEAHHPMTNEAKEALRKSEQSEQQSERLATLFSKFTTLVRKKDEQETNA
jgi:hypothetical protein